MGGLLAGGRPGLCSCAHVSAERDCDHVAEGRAGEELVYREVWKGEGGGEEGSHPGPFVRLLDDWGGGMCLQADGKLHESSGVGLAVTE